MRRLVILSFLTPALGAAAAPFECTFERNVGQVGSTVEWVARQEAGTPMFLRSTGAAFTQYGPHGAKFVEMRFEGASPAAASVGEVALESYSNYYLGRGASKWFTGVAHFGRVRYRGVYPGVDVVYHSKGREAEYDLELGPRADPSSIRISFHGIDSVRIASNGDLILTSAGSELRHRKPRIWQDGQELAGAYRIGQGNQVRFAIARYNHNRPVTIDPTIQFASYLGGPGLESLRAMAVDSRGFLYLAGSSQSIVSPGLDPFSQSGFIVSSPYIFKFSPDGKHLLFSLTLAVDNKTFAHGLAIDNTGNLLLAGETAALQLPIVNAVDPQFQATTATAFATKWTSDGRLIVYSTYFGGSGNEAPTAGAVVDAAGNLYFAGNTSSPDFPTQNALQSVFGGGLGTSGNFGGQIWFGGGPLDCFVAKLDPSGQPIFSTYLGGTGDDTCSGVALSPDGSLVIAGNSNQSDFPLANPISTYTPPLRFLTGPRVTELTGDGQALMFSTFLPGTVTGLANAVATDSAGSVYIAGSGSGLSTTNAYQDQTQNGSGYVVKLDSSGQYVLYATYLDGNTALKGTTFNSLAIGSDGSAYIAGNTQMPDYPVVNGLQQAGAFAANNLLLSKLSPSGSELVFSTLLGGGTVARVQVGPDGGVYFAGQTTASDLPTANAFQSAYGGGGDIFFAKILDDSTVSASPFVLSSSSLYFEYTQGGPPPDSQTLSVQGPAYTVTVDSPWIVATPSDSDPTILQITSDPTGLAPGEYHGTVVLEDGSGNTSAILVTFNVIGPAPELDSVSPSTIPVGSDDTQVTLTGAGFDSTTTVLLYGGPTVWASTLIDSGTMVVTIPKSALTHPAVYVFSVQNAHSAASVLIPVAVQ